MNFTLSRDDMIIAPMGDFVNQPVVYVGSMLGCNVRNFSPFFLAKLPQRRTYLLRKLKRRSEYFAPAGATKGAALGARDLFEKRSIKNFHEWESLFGGGYPLG